MSNAPRILIVDQSLKDMAGHHYEYDAALCRGAAAIGIDTIVGAHASFAALDLLGDQVRPWFKKAWYETQAFPAAALREPTLAWLPGFVRAPLANVAQRVARARRLPAPEFVAGLGDEILALIRAERFGAGDHVLVHTFSIPELDSLIEIARAHSDLPLVHIILRRDAEEPSVAKGPNGGISGSLARIAASRSAAANLRLYADTDALAQQYGALAPDLHVGVVPIPHCFPPDVPADTVRADGPLRIVYLGDARDEKGFHLLPGVVDALAGRYLETGRARFVLQANISVAGDDGSLAAACRKLGDFPKEQVELLTEQLDMSAFHTLVHSADIVLLPYDRKAYLRRSSGILIQALTAGRVVVVPAGTWMARQVEAAASVVFDSEEKLAAVVAEAIERWPNLSKAAHEGWIRLGTRHDPSIYITKLVATSRHDVSVNAYMAG
jgi:hypothetical protein